MSVGAHGVARPSTSPAEDVVDARRRRRATTPRPTVALPCGSTSTTQRLVAGRGDARGHVDRGGRLADPALLVGDRVDGAHADSDASGGGGRTGDVSRETRARDGQTAERALGAPFPGGAGSAPAWARSCGRRAACGRARPGYGVDRDAPRRARARGPRPPRAPAAVLLARRPRPSRPRRARPRRSSGAAYSRITGSAPSARAVTRSCAPSPRATPRRARGRR